MQTLFHLCFGFVCLGLLSIHSKGAEGPNNPPIHYQSTIKPLLTAHCASCHGALAQKGKLRLDASQLILKGGRSGPAITVNQPESSLIVQAIQGVHLRKMPPPNEGSPLHADQIETLKKWISQGAKMPSRETIPEDPKKHWAFQIPRKLPINQSNQNPIDHYIGQGLQTHGLVPSGEADRLTLARRLYLDLLGMPPSQQELTLYLSDTRTDSYEKLVDKLLLDPRHGERFARHWMDIWRYADWYGRRHVPDVWNSAPQVWRWRDWIVNSLNSNHGYDRMVAEMLAADELVPGDDQAAVATGYLVRNWYALNPNDWMRNIVEHTGKAFLGLTLNCAHCHDHKYDPIKQDDYFAFRAFFEPIHIRQDRVVGEADPGPFQDYDYSVLRKIQPLGMVSVFDKFPEAPTWYYTGGDERNRVKGRGSIAPHIPALFSQSEPTIKVVELPAEAINPALRPLLRETLLKEARDAIALAQLGYDKAKASVQPPKPAELDILAKAKAAYELERAKASQSATSGALEGKQSLLLSGKTGRAVIQNSMKSLNTLVDGSTLSFKLHIQDDAKFNFQLSKDSTKGLTATYVGFEKGRIVSYKPKSFDALEAGRYDLKLGQKQFEVSFLLRLKSDDCLLHVRSLSDGKKLVDGVAVALNGWNPVGNPQKPIFIDAHADSTVVIDDLRLLPPPGEIATANNSARYSFEAPLYQDQQDAVGLDGWETSSYHVPPGVAMVSTSSLVPALRKATEALELAKKEVELPQRRVSAAQKKLRATQAALADIEARLAAERATYAKPPPNNLTELKRTAAKREWEAKLLLGQADLESGEVALTEAAKSEVAKRKASIDAASKQVSMARTAIQKAEGVLKDPSQELKYSPFGPAYPSKSTGRRKALAQWITSKENPLTARVAVNHIWNWHFHSPLVATVTDFGLSGKAPTHPELLDWLAVEFMESGWDMKRLHRLIVTSNAYKRSSSNNNPTKDPENIHLARRNIGRMEAEVLRDSLLSCALKLDSQMGGRELENTLALKTFRRSIYYSSFPEDGGKGVIGDLFDGPDPLDCYRRSQSIVPQQALALTNSELVHQLSGLVTTSIQSQLSAASPDADFIRLAYSRILSRPPSTLELKECAEFLLGQPRDIARPGLIRALFNHNDFQSIR